MHQYQTVLVLISCTFAPHLLWNIFTLIIIPLDFATCCACTSTSKPTRFSCQSSSVLLYHIWISASLVLALRLMYRISCLMLEYYNGVGKVTGCRGRKGRYAERARARGRDHQRRRRPEGYRA
ncbi:hypothetical protein BGW80DRAFT_1292750 [Lactifluus volemus]|nr:hypothetical protein BGW80DRAFT_1292750 [Lactifluus volemus]